MNKQVLFLHNLIDHFETIYPSKLAESWDKVGLHFGHKERKVEKILTALDLTLEVVEEAIQLEVDTIIVHHPPLFKAIERFDLDNSQNLIYEKVIKHNINVIALHTNLDIAKNGMNDWLLEELSIHTISNIYQNEDTSNPGLGRVGTLSKAMNRKDVINLIKETFDLKYINVIEKTRKESYQRIAIIGGSGSSLMNDVAKVNPDIFLTGDITYHTAQAAEYQNFMTVDIGHHAENVFTKNMKRLLLTYQKDYNWDIEVFASNINTNPFKVE